MKIEARKPDIHMPPYEYNDCTVIALAVALGITYKEAQDKLVYIRTMCKGIDPNLLSEFLLNNGFKLMPTVNKSLQECIKLYPTGRYLLRTRNHIFNLIEGVVIDVNETSKQKILRVYGRI